MAPNTLSARLNTLESQGVIATRLYEIHPPRYEYSLTEKGKALGPVRSRPYMAGASVMDNIVSKWRPGGGSLSMSAFGTKQTLMPTHEHVRFGGKADMTRPGRYVG